MVMPGGLLCLSFWGSKIGWAQLIKRFFKTDVASRAGRSVQDFNIEEVLWFDF
jgi:hypothetical protein